MKREILIKRPYRHFKGNLYYVHDILLHTENGETLISYQALYPPYEMFARPLDLFMSEISEEREDNVTRQKFRFELFGGKL